MSQAKIFYSWQSDLPNSTNRGFIEKAIETAIKNIASDDSIQLDPVIDRDTQGVPGSPDIATTIFEKIEEAQVFIGDVSIINGQNTSRPTPNPNVLIELGYAIKTLEMRRILLVMNTAYGGPEQLPFDLRGKRAITYRQSEEDASRAEERRRLAGMIEGGLRSILDQANLRAPTNDHQADNVRALLLLEIDENTAALRGYQESVRQRIKAQTVQAEHFQLRHRLDSVRLIALPGVRHQTFDKLFSLLPRTLGQEQLREVSDFHRRLDKLVDAHANIRMEYRDLGAGSRMAAHAGTADQLQVFEDELNNLIALGERLHSQLQSE